MHFSSVAFPAMIAEKFLLSSQHPFSISPPGLQAELCSQESSASGFAHLKEEVQ